MLDTASGPPPKQPISLCKDLVSYTISLFNLEASCYPENEDLPIWLRNLAGRVERDIISQATGLGRGPFALTSKFVVRLTYHASKEEMSEAIRNVLRSLVATFKPSSAVSALPKASPQARSPEQVTGELPIAKLSESPLQQPDRKSIRQKFVEPLLDAKGWSALDWAKYSGVAYNTASDYLEGITTPYRSTRLKLATSLGIPVEKLPK